jgi:hypothetical protein
LESVFDKQKDKNVEIEGQNEDDQAKQMDIWEDSVSIALRTSGHLKANLDNIANMDTAKK